MPCKPGDRVTAVLSANTQTIKLLGHGTYHGETTPPKFPVPNPTLHLDDGTVVYGYQCWWGPEEKVLPKMQRDYPNAVVETVTIPA